MHNISQPACAGYGSIWFVFISVLLLSCQPSTERSPAGYDLNQPQKREFTKVLNEISGLHFDKESQSLLVISDSKDNIFQIDLRAQRLKDYAKNFAKQADFEDLVKVGKNVYVLISDGTILSVPPGVKNDSFTKSFKFPFKGKNDFESMYYDPSARGLVILCKTCEHEKGEGTRSAFRFDLDSLRFDSSVLFRIAIDSVKSLMKNNDISFKPSAASINPVDSNLYILGSSGQLLVIADRRGRVLKGYPLNPDRNPQAEGIAFAPNGTMFMSNEGKYGKATLQVYFYTGKHQTKKNNR
jgi:uncharacterized protein YjiK